MVSSSERRQLLPPLLCASKDRIARIHTPISYVVEHWKGEVGDWKLARNFLLVNTRNFFPPLSLPLNGIDDVVKAYYYLEDGEDNIFIDDNKFYFLFFERIKNILKL